jgi:hypothetical protein
MKKRQLLLVFILLFSVIANSQWGSFLGFEGLKDLRD